MSGTIQKKAIIYVFSGTGNTLIAAQKTAAALAVRGIRTDIYRIVSADSDMYHSAFLKADGNGGFLAGSADRIPEENSKVRISDEFGFVPDPNSYDLAGFAYPIHAFNAPQFFLRFVKHLPSLCAEKKGMRAFLFKTSGEPFKPNASSSRTLAYFLKKKGFVPGIDMHMLMPYNIMFRYPKEMAKQMYLHTEMMSDKMADLVCQESCPPLHFNPFITLFSYILRIQWLGAWINGPLHMIKKADCSGCGLCVKSCPSANIRMDQGIPKIGWKCIMCMNCTMGCPKAAINPGFLTPWKVHPKWDFPALLADDSVASNWTDNPNAGYFRFFRSYYSRTTDNALLPQENDMLIPVNEKYASLQEGDIDNVFGLEDSFGFDEPYAFDDSEEIARELKS